jgi:hypothetical protein
MCNLYSITNQAAIISLIRVINRYFGNKRGHFQHENAYAALDPDVADPAASDPALTVTPSALETKLRSLRSRICAPS